MLSEHVLISTSTPTPTLTIHDLHTYKHIITYKRCTTAKSCLAVTPAHIYSAQEEKAVINVYDRAKGTLCSTVPFTEKFTTLVASSKGTLIAGGTENGRLTIWELSSGRYISTGHIHLQRVTAIIFDPTDTFILSGSADSNVYVWSVAQLLDFRNSTEQKPQRVLDRHQREITSISTGRGGGPANIAITASKDLSCIVWNYQTGLLLRRFLFPLPPLCLALDPADRAFYAGFEDGSIHCVDFYRDSLPQPTSGILHNPTQPACASEHRLFSPQDRNVPVFLSDARNTRKWTSSGHDSPVTAIAVMYEGNFVVSGNARGEVNVWDMATGCLYRKVVALKAPVTDLKLLPPVGFLTPASIPTATAPAVPLKPRYDSLANSHMKDTTSSYAVTTRFNTYLPPTSLSPAPTSYSAFDSQEDFTLILSGASMSSSTTGARAIDSRKRVQELEAELARMHKNYEHLVGLHEGLWEKQARWMLEIGGAEGFGSKSPGADADVMED